MQTAVDRIRGEVEKLVGGAVEQGERVFDAVGLKPPVRRPAHPPVDLTETAETVVARVDLPGVRPAGVSVDLSGSILTVSGTLPQYPPAPGATAVLTERPRGSFSRSLSLPADVDADSVRAELRDGLLTVTLKKTVSAVKHTIPVTGEADPPAGGSDAVPGPLGGSSVQ